MSNSAKELVPLWCGEHTETDSHTPIHKQWEAWRGEGRGGGRGKRLLPICSSPPSLDGVGLEAGNVDKEN